jgi:serine protease Do
VVRTDELPDEPTAQASAIETPGSARADKLGITVSDLSAQQREENEAPEHGVLVTEVRDGPAKQAGVRVGDIVLLLDSNKVKDAETFKSLAAQLPAGKAISILVQRQGNPIFLALKPES